MTELSKTTQPPSAPKPNKKDSRLFTVSLMLFVSVGSLGYALTDLAGVNAPRYYPLLKIFSNQNLPDEIAMGHYGRLLTAVILGAIGVLIYLLISPVAHRFDLLHSHHVVVVMTTSVWMAVALIIIQEWHQWSIVERNLENGRFFDTEFWLLFGALNVLFFGLLFNAGFEHRITKLVKQTRLMDEAAAAHKQSRRDNIST